MRAITNREDLRDLVHGFYAKIRIDALLGPIFNTQIPDEHWPEHLIKLTDFWETNLFGVPKFKGNPTQKHVNVDKNLSHTIDQMHFDRWLQLWFETIDELFEGDVAQKAKYAAQKMSTGQLLATWSMRSGNVRTE